MRSYLPLLFLLLVFQSAPDSIRRHYEAAEAQKRAGNFAKAEAEYKLILGEGYSGLGRSFLAQKNYKEALSALQSCVAYQPAHPVLIDLSIAYFNTVQYKLALETVRRVLVEDPQSVAAHHMAGKSYFMLGEFPNAATELETALRLAPKDHDVAYTLGLAYLKQKQFAQAKKIYDRMLQQLGQRPELHIVFGRAYRETGFLGEAIEEFKQAVKLQPKFPRAHYYLGLTYLLKDGAVRLPDATEEFKIELAENPDEFFANYYLGIVYVMQRKIPLAVDFLEKASKIQPNNPDPYFHLGQAYQESGRFQEAIEVLRKAIALNPDLSHNDYQVTAAHFRLGQSLLKVGKNEEGEKELQIAADLKSKAAKRDKEKTEVFLSGANLHEDDKKFPELHLVEGIVAESSAPNKEVAAELKRAESYYAKVVASAHNNIGLMRAEQRDFHGAAEQFALAAKWNQELPEINFNWGLALFKGELYKDAIPAFTNELKINPANVAAKQLLGLSYFMIEDYSKASDLLNSVLASKPNEAGLYYPLAISLVKQGRRDEADKVIQQMIMVGGNSPQVHLVLSQAYYEQGDTKKALEELNAALTQDSKTLLAHYYSGQILLKMGKFDEAVREFESELSLNPSDVRARYNLAFVLLANQKIESGIKAMREVIQRKPDYAEAHYELGKALLQRGDVKGAVESLEVAARLKPAESYVHYQLGRAYIAAGRNAEGDRHLEIAKQLKEKSRSQSQSNP